MWLIKININKKKYIYKGTSNVDKTYFHNLYNKNQTHIYVKML